MKRVTLIITAVFLCMTALTGEINGNAGTYGYQFLDISTNPVSLALAGRGILSGSDLASFTRQPACGVLDSHQSLGVSYMMWLSDTKFNNIYYSNSDRKTHFGLALRNLDYGQLEIRDDSGNLIGYYSPLNMDVLANYSLRITPAVYAGLNAGIAYEKLNTDSSIGVHTDLGVTMLPPIRNTRLSLAVRNLGLSSAMNEDATKFAPSFEVDISKSYDFDKTLINLELSGLKAIDENWKAALTTQLVLHDIVALRAGYKLNYDAENISAGIGVRLGKFNVDYGWAMFTNHLNDVHSLGISYLFR